MVKALHHTGGKFAAAHKRDKILKPVWGVDERQQSYSQLSKKLRAARNSQARLQYVGAAGNSEPSLHKKSSTFLLEADSGEPLRWAIATRSGDSKSKAEEETQPAERSALQEEWTSLEKRNPQPLVDPVLAKWNSIDSSSLSPRKRKFRELSRLAPFSIPVRRNKNVNKDPSSCLSCLLNSPIIGNRELTEEEESVVGQVSVLLNEEAIVVVPIDPLIIEVAYLQKQFTTDGVISRPRSQQTSQAKLQPLDEEYPCLKLDSELAGSIADESDSKEVRVKHKIVARSKTHQQEHSKQLSPSDIIPPELEAEFEISKKKIIGNPDLHLEADPKTDKLEISNLCEPTQDANLLDAPQVKRAAPAKSIETSTLVSWTLIGKRMTPVFQDVQINKWPSMSERKTDIKSPTHPLITSSGGKSKGSVITDAHPWQNLLKDFGPSFDDSSDEDTIQKGIVFMKKHLFYGIRDLDRRNSGEIRNMEVVSDILMTPVEIKEGTNPSIKTKAAKPKIRPSMQDSLVDTTALQQTLASTHTIELVNLHTIATVQHCSAAELSSQKLGLMPSQPGSLCDSSDDLSHKSSPHSPRRAPVEFVLPISQRELLTNDGSEEEFL